MKLINKFIILLLAGLMVFSVGGLTAFASDTESDHGFEETDLPQGLNFTVNDTCTDMLILCRLRPMNRAHLLFCLCM